MRLAWRIINEHLKASDIETEIKSIGSNFPANEAAEQLRNENCYEAWEGKLRYLLYRYEEYLSEKNNQNFENEQWERIWEESPSRSIEHIWPQSRAAKSAKHRLGNLTILPPRLNSRLRDKKPQDKVDEYRKTGLLVTEQVARLIESRQKWNTKTIDERESDLIEWVKQEWAD